VIVKVSGKWASFLILLPVFFSFLYIYLQLNGLLKVYSTNLFSHILYPELKLENPIDFSYRNTILFNLAYPHILPYILVIGAIFALLSRKKDDVFMTFMLAFILLIVFLPDLMAYRVYHLLPPFSSYILSLGFVSIIREASKVLGWKRNSRIKHATCILLTIMMFLTTFPPLAAHIHKQSHLFSLPPPKGYTSVSIADYEYDAAFWIKANLPETTVIISDYKTIQILGSIGDTIWLTGRSMSAESLCEKSKRLLSIIKNNVFNAKSSKEAYYTILTLPELMHILDKQYIDYVGIKPNNLTFIIVLSPRTVKWIEQQGIGDILRTEPSKVSPEYLELFNDPRYFKLIYKDENGYLYIYELIKTRF